MQPPHGYGPPPQHGYPPPPSGYGHPHQHQQGYGPPPSQAYGASPQVVYVQAPARKGMHPLAIVAIVLGVVALIGGGICLALGVLGSRAVTASRGSSGGTRLPNVFTTPEQLHADYKANEVAADAKYKGKRLQVDAATIKAIEKDFKDDIVLRLKTPHMFDSIHATLADGEEAKASKLNKGQRVILLCRGNGMIIGSPMLDDCVL